MSTSIQAVLDRGIGSSKIPEKRRAELLATIGSYVGKEGKDVTAEDIEAVANLDPLNPTVPLPTAVLNKGRPAISKRDPLPTPTRS